ncbi:hypothetical protein CRG98_010804 [Punica granatum]|uniref:Uncharacterized protein n=1 Tax=Punica granatum TaxID=22663 RepID=A0A2I0KJQ8_PUNGR|nr:hypothetical protein CRG98_010804 [Punica granatum]
MNNEGQPLILINRVVEEEGFLGKILKEDIARDAGRELPLLHLLRNDPLSTYPRKWYYGPWFLVQWLAITLIYDIW